MQYLVHKKKPENVLHYLVHKKSLSWTLYSFKWGYRNRNWTSRDQDFKDFPGTSGSDSSRETSLVPTFEKPLEKVWSEDAWELTFHSPVKTANLDKNTSEKSFSCHFVKKGSDIWSIFLHFFITSIKNLTWIQLSHYMGRNLC